MHENSWDFCEVVSDLFVRIIVEISDYLLWFMLILLYMLIKLLTISKEKKKKKETKNR